jgi:DNA gyrase subunit A
MAEIIKEVKVEDEVKASYLDYAMSVIVSRALPDARDGLKPGQRRILYAMNELGIHHNSPFKKSARIVGEVLGKYHPHGDTSVYDTMVRMAQDFSLRYPLIDGQGNFGSVDNDPPAAMRYTEARLSRIAQEMLLDIDKDTVDFTPNFDDSLTEPAVLPSRIPNLLINGSSGIAVGMATNIPPHNLGEVARAISFLIDHPQAAVDELLEFIPGPDFPTGGIILGQEEIRRAYATGRGKIIMRGKAQPESKDGKRPRIIITELPFQTNKAELVERIAKLAKERRIDGISEIRDESDRQGISVVIELKKEAPAEHVLNNLYNYTSLQSTFFVNMVALVEGAPKVVNLKEMLQLFIDSRREVIIRRSNFELRQARERAHILEGLKIAIEQLDQIVLLIRRANSIDQARSELMSLLNLSSKQTQAILDLPLRRLTSLEQEKILTEHTEVLKNIAYLEDLLASQDKISSLIKQELSEIGTKYGEPRRTQLSEQEVRKFDEADLIPHQEVVIIISDKGFIKRLPADTYRLQHRGGHGVGSLTAKEGELALIFSADTHDNLLLFTDRGKAFSLKCYRIPQEVSRTVRGTPLVNLIPIDPQETIVATLPLKEFPSNSFIILATQQGKVKRTNIDEFARLKNRGIIAISVNESDRLVGAGLATNEQDELILVAEQGKAIKIGAAALEATTRTSKGRRGLRLGASDKIAGLGVSPIDSPLHLLTVTARGFGKLTHPDAFSLARRGRKGIRAHKISAKTGGVMAVKMVSLAEELIVITTKGVTIRLPMQSIHLQGRNTAGLSLIRMDKESQVAAIATLSKQ